MQKSKLEDKLGLKDRELLEIKNELSIMES